MTFQMHLFQIAQYNWNVLLKIYQNNGLNFILSVVRPCTRPSRPNQGGIENM